MNSDQKILIESFKQSHPQTEFHKPNSVYEALQFLSFVENIQTESCSIIEERNIKYYIEASVKKIKESIDKDNTFIWPYTVAPYFTHEEVEQFSGYYCESNGRNTKIGDSFNPRSTVRKIKELKDKLRATVDPDEISEINARLDALNKYSGETENFYEATATQFNPRSWTKKITQLTTKLKTEEDPEQIDYIKQELVNLGWNPEIDFTAESQIMAKKRIESIYQERYKSIVLDITSLVENLADFTDGGIINESSNNVLKPIHVVLVKGDSPFSSAISKVTDSQFSHSAICIDNDFHKLYSFNLNNSSNFTGGFSIEDIDNYPKDNRLAVFSFFVSKDDHEKISKRIKMLVEDIKDTSYSVINILTMPFKHINFNFSNSMICSQFVDSILKMAHVDITNKDSSKVVPNDFYKASITNSKIYKVFDGITKDFNPKKIIAYINKMSNKAKPFIEGFATDLLADYLYPCVTEAKLPIEFNKDGDLLLTNKFIDFDAEYSSSHKLLLSYAKSNNLEGMKYELARLYYMNYILERRLYHNKSLSNKEKNIKTRARVLNDFKKYLDFVLDKEPEFNFGEYYEKSIFYPHTIEVKNSTMLKLKDIINYIL